MLFALLVVIISLVSLLGVVDWVWYSVPRLNPLLAVSRMTFADLTPVFSAKPKNHSHPNLACERSSMSEHISRLAANLGLSPYYIQMSASDQRKGRIGCREFIWSKDLMSEARDDPRPVRPLYAMVDVDYYLDMPQILADTPGHYALYTFTPTAVAAVSSEYSFTFNCLDEVEFSVSGGAHYKHKVWNYNRDTLVASNWYSGTVYAVERRILSDHHSLVFLIPIRTYRWYNAWRLWMDFGTEELTRLVVFEPQSLGPGFTRLSIRASDKHEVSTGRPGQFLASTVSVAIDARIAVVARTTKVGLTLPTVLSHVNGDHDVAAPLLEYHLARDGAPRCTVFPTPFGVRNYQFNPATHYEDAKPLMHPFASPIVPNCYVPTDCPANTQAAIEGRVTSLAQDLHVSPTQLQMMDEFLAELIPVPHMMDPTDLDEVCERQSRPTQRRIISAAADLGPHFSPELKMTLKKENYESVKDPRPITVPPPTVKVEFSRYTYPLAEHVKTTEWYAFGRSPVDIARRVAHCLVKADSASNTDYARYDGRVNAILREFERRLLLRAFRPAHHASLLEAHRGVFGQKVLAPYRKVYDLGFARGSGDPSTAVFNSVENAFIDYCVKRDPRNPRRCEPKEAYARLTIYGGDDGIVVDASPELSKKVAEEFGMSLEITPVARGELGVKFLARVYGPHVWFGSLNSCCDLPRALTKLHVSTALPPSVTPAMKYGEKLFALSLTDPQTPVVTELCAWFRGQHSIVDRGLGLTGWWGQYAAEVQYPNQREPWMEHYATTCFPLWGDWVESLRTLRFPELPLLCDVAAIAAKADVVVGQEVHRVPPPIPPKPKLQSPVTPPPMAPGPGAGAAPPVPPKPKPKAKRPRPPAAQSAPNSAASAAPVGGSHPVPPKSGPPVTGGHKGRPRKRKPDKTP